ncbi:MAG: LysM peptidoglycan-binding domain-containing protein [Bacillota bacterium]
MLKGFAAPVVAGTVFLALLLTPFASTNQITASASEFLPGPGQFTVRSGDSLFIIARKFGVSIADLKRLNQLGSDMIMPGQVLMIPARTTGLNRYIVRNGDSLFIVAGFYGLTVGELKRANALDSDLIMPGQVLRIPVKERPLSEVLDEKGIITPEIALDVVVDKTDHTLTLFWQGMWLKTYHVELGDGGMGDKEIRGDHKTPEGLFCITEKSILSPPDEFLGSRWMRLNYPNIEDADRGLHEGLIEFETHDLVVSAVNSGQTPPQYTPLGGGIGIHGGSTPGFGSDWTWGCVGLSNRDVEDFYDFITPGTRVIIQW